jgi:ABC-type branched-subunit amino acid transport system substrate-binding protein
MKKVIVMAVVYLASMLCIFASPGSAENGVTDGQIAVGMSTVLTGPASFLGTSFKTGAEAYLKIVNESGGVHGRKIKLIVYDDGYEPGRTVPNVTKLINEDKVFCLLGNVGTPTTMAIKPIITQEKVPLFAPFTGAEPLRHPVVKYILNYRASYNQEAEEFIKGMVDVLGYKKVGVFFQDDAYGRVVLEGTRRALEKRGLKPEVTGTYKRNTEDIEEGLSAIMAGKPEAVVMVGTYGACGKFIREGKQKGFNPIYMNVSFVGPDKLAELLGKDGEGEVVTNVVPPFYGDAGQQYVGVKEYLESTKKYFPGTKPSFVGLEGFLAAKVFVEGLKRAGKGLTRESFVKAVEGINDLDIGAGNRISFSEENHQGSQKVYPTVIKNGKYQLIKDWSLVKQR